MYGLNPRSITSRIARFTYGINTLTTFDSKKCRFEKKVIIERSLKKSGKSISQAECKISIGEDYYEGSVTEIKNKILLIIGTGAT